LVIAPCITLMTYLHVEISTLMDDPLVLVVSVIFMALAFN
jgi:hypothetical protein